jgi:hypothetical protein
MNRNSACGLTAQQDDEKVTRGRMSTASCYSAIRVGAAVVDLT